MDIITSHMNADFDACASMVAVSYLYPGAVLVFPGSQELKVRDFIKHFYEIPTVRFKDLDPSEVKRLVVVDAGSPERIGPLAVLLEQDGVDVHVYDHHTHDKNSIKGSLEIVEHIGATTTLIVELLRKKRIKPAPMEATLFMLGIYEETGLLTSPDTTERDMLAAAWLLKRGASLNIVSRQLKQELSAEELRLLNECSASAKEEVVGGLRVLTATASSEQYVGDAAHLAHRLLDMHRADVVLMALRMEGKVLLVGRSHTPQANMGAATKELGGGGH
ncbi:MAG: DHH family phosphoesterase, partial [Thermodesulfovibrionales bacterium]|nr:DHH family phosphoesterase [Thermodesulfovibrionales bacterium]